MTVLERKAKFVTDILTDTNEERFTEMEEYYNLLKERESSEPEPCMYTVEEIKVKLPAIIKELEDGKGIPHEAIKRKAVS